MGTDLTRMLDNQPQTNMEKKNQCISKALQIANQLLNWEENQLFRNMGVVG